MTALFPYCDPDEQKRIKDHSQFNYLQYQQNRKPFKEYNDESAMRSRKTSKIQRMARNQYKIMEIEK